VTRFFIPGVKSGPSAERAYDELRAYAQARTERRIRATRIRSISCRRGGMDSQLTVGEPDPHGGETVNAIFATSDGCTVVWEGGFISLTRRQIYEAIPFD
jgi:hypothetical protein